MSTFAWQASPRTRRVTADLAEILRRRHKTGERIALLIGAGVDIQLTGRLRWAKFVESLAAKNELETDSSAVRVVSERLPVEAAEAVRIGVGREAYYDSLAKITSSQPIGGVKMARAIRGLVNRGINLIVNFNYTRDFENAITDKKREIIVIQRTHLPGWPKRDLLNPKPGKIHLIAIHGTVERPLDILRSPVLDQQSYDDALFSDFHYTDLLLRLFQDFTVVSIGLSWDDVALRSAAAKVHFASPLFGRGHSALLPRTSSVEADGNNPWKVDLWKERSLVAAYAVRPLFYSSEDDHEELVRALVTFSDLPGRLDRADQEQQRLATKLSSRQQVDDLRTTADLLDACGDYESLFQRQWFAWNWEALASALKSGSTERLTPDQWMVLARLERHLRHFVWVYAAPDDRDGIRKAVWSAIALAGRKLLQDGSLNAWSSDRLILSVGPSAEVDERGIFEFALGAYEVFTDEVVTQPEVQFWRGLLDGDLPELPKARVQIAKVLWSTPARPQKVQTIESLTALRRAAIACGWEGIDAKLALDICELKFKAARALTADPLRALPDRQRRDLLNHAMDAREAARAAGSGRRELGAVALGSIVSDPERAESDLVGVYQGFSKRIEAGAGPVGDWGIYVALLASLLDRSTTPGKIQPADARAWIEERCGSIDSAPLVSTKVDEVIEEYWRPFHPAAADLAMRTAALIRPPTRR